MYKKGAQEEILRFKGKSTKYSSYDTNNNNTFISGIVGIPIIYDAI